MPRHSQYQPQVQALRTQMVALVKQAARETGSLQMRAQHADNYWTVTVNADGTVKNEDYAYDARGGKCSVDDLSFWELAHLVSAL